MQQIVQELGSGELRLAEVPDPIATPGRVLIANSTSLISAGTEKSVRQLAQKSLLQKARERPDHVRRVLQKVRQEGLLTTIQQVRGKLSQPTPLGYSSAGVVVACGSGVQGIRPGDRVASNGSHSDLVSVPKHLCAVVPDGVSDEQAAFTVVASIALQGVRLSRLVLGETAFVIGLGLVGQITASLLRAAGCRVLGTDLDADKCELALTMGCDVARPALGAEDVERMTGGLGADAVLVTAATPSSTPVRTAARAVRKKGRIVLVGSVGMELERPPLYEKEAELVVSCSYGPGRYDPLYEDRGLDYPAAHVRWTEQRNLRAVLDLMATGRLDVSHLISHRMPIDEAMKAYRMIETDSEPYLGVILQYDDPESRQPKRTIELRSEPGDGSATGFGCIGAGNFAANVILPAIREAGDALRPEVLCTARGLSAADQGERFGFPRVTTEQDSVFEDPRVGAVFLITRHDSHAELVIRGLESGKHVFVEKPLALHADELVAIEETLLRLKQPAPLLMVGFNRRFSPAAQQVRAAFSELDVPLTVSIRFNAGAIAPEEWPQDETVGGGRIIGEACHAIDLATFLVGSPPVRVFAESIGGPRAPQVTDDQSFLVLRHADGSVSSIAYLAGGDRAFSKERVEVLGGGRVAVIEDFREVLLVSGGKTRRSKALQQDKGHRSEVACFARAVTEGLAAPIPWPEIRAVSWASILAVRSLREGVPFPIP